jgi:hypothetical protein
MRHPLSLFIIALMTATTVVMGAVILSNPSLVQAQTEIKPEFVAAQFYERLPDFPKENQYLRKGKKTAAADNTLVSRLFSYHTVNQSRSPQYRLDWKITLADYLGINEYIINPKNYPGAAFLKTNPFEQDQAILQSLSREERNQVIDTVVSIINSEIGAERPQSTPPNQSEPSPATTNRTPSEKATDLLLNPTAPSQGEATLEQPTGAARFLLPDEAP